MPDIDSGVLKMLHEHVKQNIPVICFEPDKAYTPLFAMCEHRKEKDGYGKKFVVRFEDNEGAAVGAEPDEVDDIAGDGDPGGRPSRDYMNISRTSLDSPFVFTRDEILAIAGKSTKEQFRVISSEVEHAIRRVRNMLAEQVSGSGWGDLCQISAISATSGDGTGGVGYVTIPDWAANRFRVGWRITASASADTDVLLGTPAGASLRVTAIGTPTAGTVKLSLSGNPVTVWTNSSSLYLFRRGNRLKTDPSATESNKKVISGLRAYVDPTATSTLWDVVRAGNPDRAGHEVDCTGLDTWEALLEIAERAFMWGRELDTILISGRSWKLLNLDAQSLRTVYSEKNDFKIGFKAFEMPTPNGSVMVAPDAFLRPGEAWAGPFSDKEKGPAIYYAGDSLIGIDNIDGRDFVRRPTTGSRDFGGQVFFSGQFVLPCPGLYFKGTNLPTS